MGTERGYLTCLIAICAGKINQNAVAKRTPLKPISGRRMMLKQRGHCPSGVIGSHVCLRSIYRKMWRFKSSLGHFKSCDLKLKNRIHKIGKKIPAKKSLKKLRA
jgi:hypothetical protein